MAPIAMNELYDQETSRRLIQEEDEVDPESRDSDVKVEEEEMCEEMAKGDNFDQSIDVDSP